MSKSRIKSALIKKLTRGSQQPLVAWAETLVIALISSAIWIASVSVSQILTYEGSSISVSESQGFFWPLIFVMLVSMRYGFSQGFCCALLTILFSIAYYKYEGILFAFSFYKAVGMLLTAMISGEFRDVWDERLHRNDLDCSFIQRKLDLFTQTYFILRASHDQLEQRMAGQVVSLRSNISELEKISRQYPLIDVSQEQRLTNMASSVLSLFASIVGIEVAGMYQIDSKERIITKPLATLGNMGELDLSDPMLRDMLICQNLLSPIDLYAKEQSSKYQLCIPIKDSSGKLLACVIAPQIKFFTLTDQNIAILNLVVNYAADMVSTGVIAPVIESEEKHTFMKYLKFVFTESTLRHEQSSLMICRGRTDDCLKLFDKTISTRRGADIYWRCKDTKGNQVLLVMLPLTTMVQAQLFKDRVVEQIGINKEMRNAVELIGPLDVSIDNDVLLEQLRSLGLTDDDIDLCTKFN